MSETAAFTVSTQSELNSAIQTLDATSAPGTYTINFSGDVDESGASGIDAIYAAPGVDVVINGDDHALNGEGAGGGLAVIGGKVSINDLTIEDTTAQGGAGSGSAGGGAGLGGGLFVGPTASVTLNQVQFGGAAGRDTAIGGTGGAGGGGGAGGKSSLIVPQLGDAGSTGDAGVSGTQAVAQGGTFTAPGVTGPAGGDGDDGGEGGFGAAGGKGGDGGQGGTGGAGSGSVRDGGDGGVGADAGAGGQGGIGGSGGDGGDGGAGGAAGAGAYGGHGGNGGDGGDGGKGGDGGAGGFGAGGGAGGAADSITNNVQLGYGGTQPGGQGGGGLTGGNGGNGGDGGDGGHGGSGGFGGGGGGGGNGGEGGEGNGGGGGLSAARGGGGTGQPGVGGIGGDGGDGGTGGFGGGGGGGGLAGDAGDNLFGDPSSAGTGGKGENGGFGAGAGTGARNGKSGAGGGGLGAGGDIFVSQGGSLTVDGGLLELGAVEGGASSGNGGEAFGSGIFLQGDETITLAAPRQSTLAVNGVIADQTGSGGSGATAGIGRIDIAGSGTVQLADANTFVGGVLVLSGTVDLAHTGAAGSGPIVFENTGASATVEFDVNTAPVVGIEDFAAGDRLKIDNFAYTQAHFANGALVLDGDGQTLTVSLPDAETSNLQYAVVGGDTIVTACFAAGTRIRTNCGEVAIETLAVGDLVATASGGWRPIVWLGHRRIDLTRHSDPAAVQPVRVGAGAFGEGVPHRDLWLSPGHNVASEGALIPISALVNGISIAQIVRAEVEYWHVELDAHDILFSEGLPAESYLDCGNRTAFSNGGAFFEAHPDFKPKHWAETCLPLATDGPAVARARAHLLSRLAEEGCKIVGDADPYVEADGLRIDPIELSATRLGFVLPEGRRKIILRSRTFTPAHTDLDSRDPRELGLCVGRLFVDGKASALADETFEAKGWGDPEFVEGRFVRRWTNGAATLPAEARLVIIDLAGNGYYWSRSDRFGRRRFRRS